VKQLALHTSYAPIATAATSTIITTTIR